MDKLIAAARFATQQWKNTFSTLALLALLGLTACGEDLSDADHVARAETAFHQGDLNTTAIELKNALKLNPANARARLLLGKTYLLVGDGAASEKELRRAQEMGVPEQEVYLPLAQALLLRGEYKEVLESFPVGGQLAAAERAELLAIRGHSLMYTANIDEARKTFDEALASDDQLAAAMLGHAYIDKALGELESARKWLDKSLAADPAQAQSWSLLGDIERLEGNLDEAEKDYGKAILNSPYRDERYRLQRALLRIDREEYLQARLDLNKLSNKLPGKHYGMGLIKLREQAYLDAQSLFEQALSRYEDYAPAKYYLGLTHTLLGNDEQAISYLRQYLNEVPDSATAVNLLAKLEIRKGDLAAAEALLDPLFQKNPGEAQTLDMMAGLELIQGNQDKALEQYRQLTQLHPESGRRRSNLGLALIASGDIEQGTAEMEKAIELAPEDEQLELRLILAQINSSERTRAVASAQNWVKRSPKNVTAYLALGWAELQNSHPNLAKAAFSTALELSPGNPSASHNLAVFATYAADIKTAIAYYEQSQMFYQGHPQNSISLAKLYLLQGETDKAISLLESSIELFPNVVPTRSLLAQTRLKSGATKQALEEAEALARAHPENTGILSLLGAARAADGKYNQAINAYVKLQDLRALSAGDHYLLAQAYYRAGNERQFVSTLEAAYEAHPENFEIQIAKVGLLTAQGQLEQAEQLLDEIAAAHPRVVEVQLQAAKVAEAQGKPKAAVAALATAREIAPERSDLVVKHALALYRAGDEDKALQEMKRRLQQRPEDSVVEFNLANLYLLDEKKEEAKTTFASILAREPNNALVLNNMAWLLKDQSPQQALKYAERANQLAPETPSFQDTLAMLLLDLKGQEARAVTLLRNAVEKAPQRADLQYHLARALAQNGDNRQASRTLSELLREHSEFSDRAAAESLLAQLQR